MLIKIRLESRFETRNWAASFSRFRTRARMGARGEGEGEGEGEGRVDAGTWTKWSYFASVPCLPFCLFPSGKR